MEPRIVFDSCSGLLYLADYYESFGLYSYNPTTGAEAALPTLPGGNNIQDGLCGDKSGHIYAVTNTSVVYEYNISSGTWTGTSGGPTGEYNSACGVGADGYLYATDPAESAAMYRIQLY